MDYSPFQHGVYIMRWVALAVPGAWFLVQVQKRIKGTYAAMVVSQAILGAIVFWVDRLIFNLRRELVYMVAVELGLINPE